MQQQVFILLMRAIESYIWNFITLLSAICQIAITSTNLLLKFKDTVLVDVVYFLELNTFVYFCILEEVE